MLVATGSQGKPGVDATRGALASWEGAAFHLSTVTILAVSTFALTQFFLTHRGAQREVDGIRGQGEWPEARLHQSCAPQQAGRPHPLQGQWLEGSHGPCGGPVRCPRGVQCGLVSASGTEGVSV